MEFNVIEAFEKHHVILNGHFRLRSGKHSNMYISKDKLYTIPEIFQETMQLFYEIMPPKFSYDVIISPAEAGIALASVVGIVEGKPVTWSSKFKFGNITKMEIREQFKAAILNNRVLLLEDVITTGGSTEKTMQAVHDVGGEVTAVRCIWNRENWRPKTTASFKTLVNRSVQSWEPSECPICKKGEALFDPKTGKITEVEIGYD